MSSIDERVVEMKFNNSQFESGVKQTTQSLDTLKKGLKLDGATKGFEEVDGASKKINLSGLVNGVETLASKFSALSIIGITALTNIANKAVDAGITLAKSLTVDPIKQGLEEYETNLNSIQTILANTEVSGATLDDVNGALSDLNTYSDKTIYNFSEMAKNIGTFTAAGVDLKTSTQSIKGIANLAALSGSNSQQAAGAMYQLSQAISSGKVSLEDWNSVVNAGMGGTTFQRALAQTAVAMGKLPASALKLDGAMKNVTINGESFRNSISATNGESWLSGDVLTTTLKQFTADLSDAEIAAMGFNDEQVAAIQQTAKTAMHAATEVKTLSAVFDTAKETVGSGWAQTWQLIFGDFKEAKDFFTGMSNGLNDLLNASSDARNNVLKSWKDFGGRRDLIAGLTTAAQSLLSIVKVVGKAFADIFPPITGWQLATITKGFMDLMTALKPSDATLNNIGRIFKGIFAVLDIGWTIIKQVARVFSELIGQVAGGTGGFLEFAAKIGDWLVKVRDAIKAGDGLTKFFDGLATAIKIPLAVLGAIAIGLGKMIDIFVAVVGGGADRIGERLKQVSNPLKNFGDAIGKVFEWVGGAAGKAWKAMEPLVEKIGRAFERVADTIKDAFANMDFSKILDLVNTGLLVGLFAMFKKFLKGGGMVDMLKQVFGIGEGGGATGIVDSIKEVFGGLTDTLGAMQANLKSGTLMKIAGAVALLTISVVALSLIDSAALTKALGAIAVMFTQLLVAMVIMEKITASTGFMKMPFVAGALILMAIAIDILAIAVAKLGKLKFSELIKGLIGVTTLMFGLATAARIMSKSAPGLIPAAVAMVILAVGINILAEAVKKLSELNVKELAKGLGGVAILLAELALFNKFNTVTKGSAINAVGIVILAVAIKLLADAVAEFSKIPLPKLIKGLGGVAVALAIMAGFNKIGGAGFQMIGLSVGLVVMGAALKIIADALGDFAGIPLPKLIKGLIGMAGALAIIAGAVYLLPPSMIAQAIGLVVVGAALKIIASALKDMGGMSWEEIGKSMVVLAGSLLILAIGLTAMIVALPGAVALLVVSAALMLFVPVLQALGGMEWSAIWTGLGALALSLLLLGIAGVALLPAIPGLLLLGVAIVLLGTGTLLAGAGIMMFSAGLATLAVAGAAAGAVLLGLVKQFLDLLPYAIEQVGKGIVAFAKVIGDNVPTFIDAMVKLILGLLQAIDKTAPAVIDTLFSLILKLLRKIDENLPEFVERGANIIVNFLNGVAARMGDIVDAAVKLINNFIDGIARNLPSIQQSGANLIISFVESLAGTVRNNSERLGRAGGDLASAIIEGMVNGLGAGIGRVAEKAREMASNAYEAAKKFLDINSPSRKFRALGDSSAEGMSAGIERSTGMVERSAVSMGESALASLQKTVSGGNLNSLLDIDGTPTIRPVLDLSSVQKAAGQIGNMIQPPTLALDSTYAKASYLADATSTTQEAVPVAAMTGQSDTYIFNQYNSSPKSLGEGEIYRQTNNLLSRLSK